MIINDFEFIFESECSCILEDKPVLYNGFFGSPEKKKGFQSLHISCQFSAFPAAQNFSKIFEDKGRIKIFTDTDSFLIQSESPSIQKIWYGAVTDRSMEEAKIYCHETDSVFSKNIISSFVYNLLLRFLFKHALISNGGSLFHGASIQWDEKGYLFTGKSGAGKSTISRRFSEADSESLFNDEISGIRYRDNQHHVFGTPWTGESGIARNQNAPLSGIFLLVHGSENQIMRVAPEACVQRLLPLISVPWYDRASILAVLAFLEKLIIQIPIFEFRFKPDHSAVRYFETFIGKHHTPKI